MLRDGKRLSIRTRKYTNGNEEEIVSEDSRQMIEDMEQMANGLKDMAKNLTGANVDVNEAPTGMSCKKS